MTKKDLVNALYARCRSGRLLPMAQAAALEAVRRRCGEEIKHLETPKEEECP